MSARAELLLLRPAEAGVVDAGEVVPGLDEGWRRRGVCAGQAPGWDLDRGTLGDWRRAREGCRRCPVLAQCRAELLAWYPRAGESRQLGESPIGVTWAGITFGPRGLVLDDRALRSLWTRAQSDQQQTGEVAAAAAGDGAAA